MTPSALGTQPETASPQTMPWWEWAGLALILLVAVGLRVWRLDVIPPGLTHDEAGHGQDAIAILNGARPLYQTVGYGREPLYDYVVALGMALSGQTSYLVLRAVSATFGVLTVALTYLWVRRAFGRWEALLTCAGLATSFWAVSVSRQGLRSSLLPALQAAAVYAWWRGAYDGESRSRGSWGWFGLSGLLVGATLWTYMAARATWALFLALPLYLLFTDRRRLKRRWPGMLLTVVLAWVVAAPMFIWLRLHPDAEQRFAQLAEPLQRLVAGDLGQVIGNGLQALGMFIFRADDLWMYNLPGRPWLSPVLGILFYVGVGLAVWRWKQLRYVAALMWLVLGMASSLVTGVSASATRSVAIIPLLYLFPALLIVSGVRWLVKPQRVQIATMGAMAGLILASTTIVTYHDYFTVWGEARDVRTAYHTTLFEVARDLDGRDIPAGAAMVVSTIYPGRFHDPYALDLMISRQDISLRWMDGRGALIFPADPCYLVVKALAPLDPALEPALASSYARTIESRRLRPDDLNPGFEVYEWDSAAALEEMLSRAIVEGAGWRAGSTFPAEEPQRVYQPLRLPADLGHTIALIGYDLSASVVEPGDELVVITYWRVLAPVETDLDTVLFTHLLSPTGDPPIVAQQDRLDAPAWNWHVGEAFAQVHRLSVGKDVAEGLYPVEVGAYTRANPSPLDPNPLAVRFSLYVEGESVGDRILLPPVAVRR